MTYDLVLTGAAVITMDAAGTVLCPGAVAILGDRIAAVGPGHEAASWPARRRRHRPDAALLPGFVDGHDHLFQSLARHRGDGLGLYDWLRQCMWPYADSLSVEDALVATRFAAVELVQAGFTTVVDHAYAPTDPEATLAVAAAIEAVGLRGFVARGLYGTPLASQPARRPSPLDTAEELAVLRELMLQRAGQRVAVVPGPANVTTVRADVLEGAAALAREFAVPWHSHCCEVASDADALLAREGRRAVAWMDGLGVLDRHATLAHTIWVDPSEIELLARTGTACIHNPTSNARFGSGVMPVRAMRDAGVRLGLGVDGSAGHHADPFALMRAALAAQRLSSGPASLAPNEVLAMATRDGAAALGLDAGTLEPGQLADVVAVRLPPLAGGDVVGRLVWGADARDVLDVVVDGSDVVVDGRPVHVDEADLRGAADAAVRRLWGA